MYSFLKTTFLGGVLFLVPVVVLIAIIAKALEVAKPVVVPLNDALFQGTVAHAYVGDLLAFALLLVLCFLAGLAAKTSFARKSVDALEKKVLAKVPAYDSIKSKFVATLQSQEGETMRARIEGLEQVLATARGADTPHPADFKAAVAPIIVQLGHMPFDQYQAEVTHIAEQINKLNEQRKASA
jgi:hypothetical protein